MSQASNSCADAAYSHAEGDRIEDRNTYQYSTFAGSAFLVAWESSRFAALDNLGPAAPSDGAQMVPQGLDTAGVLERIAEAPSSPESRAALERIIQRFEVTKRVHGQYGPDNRAIDRGDYHDLRLYVRFAELLEQRHAAGDTLVPLNTLLKCLDSLCSVQDRLRGDVRGRVARLIELERGHVQALAARLEATW